MGLFKQMKQAKDVVSAAPDMIQNAQAMQQAQLDAAQANEAGAGAGAAGTGGADFVPVAGVSIEIYAAISRTLTDRGGDQAAAPGIAAEHGVDAESWAAAVAEWNIRMQRNPAVGTRFNQLWRGVG